MRALSQSALLRYIMFGLLYLAQGLPWGFISVGYVVFLTDQGLNNEAIGWAVGIGYIPWSFKLIWGPVIDRFPSKRFGRRRHFIILSELMMGFTMLSLVVLDPAHQLNLLAAVLFLNNTFASIQDVAVDALAVDVLRTSEQGRANSIMWAGKSLGVAIGGGAGTVLAKYVGWTALFTLLAVSLWLIMLLPLLVRERTQEEDASTNATNAVPWRMIWDSFAFRAPLVGLLVAVLTPMGYGMIGAPSTHLMRATLKFSEEAIGTLSGVVDPISGVVGALFGGYVADKLGLRQGVAIFMAMIALTMAGFTAVPQLWPSFPFLIGYTAVFSFAISAFNAAALGYFMSISNPAVGATQFSIYMAGINLCYAIGSPLGGRLADELGYQGCFAVAAVIQVLTIGLVFLSDPRSAAARFESMASASGVAPLKTPGV